MIAETSREAYAALEAGRGTQQRILLAALRRYGPMTRQQLSQVTGLPINTVCGRCCELIAVDHIEVVGVMWVAGKKRMQPRQVLAIRPDLIDRLEEVPHATA